jgi:predicted nucleic acid-binding protein
VPAIEHPFSDPAPARLYVDTDILISHSISTEPHHVRCTTFLERLAREGRTTLHVSSLSWMEFAHVVTRDGFRNRLDPTIYRRYQLQHWRQARVRPYYLRDLLNDLEELLNQFNWFEIPLTPAVRVLASAYMADFALGSQDAVHLASAAAEGMPDFASLDSVYRRVDGLSLWNDLVR